MMNVQHISLDGDWQLAFAPEGRFQIEHPDDLDAAGMEVIRAQVPGNVELDLFRAGRLPDPFYADHIRQLRPFEFYEWWYTREIDLGLETGENTDNSGWDLVFAGLDTLATVWVNGVQVGKADNALIEHRFDVTEALQPGSINRITVRLRSAVNAARAYHYDASMMSWEHREEGLFVRKAPHVWGWDIMPRAVSAGLWRSVWLEKRQATAIEQLYYWTIDAGSETATLGVRFQFRVDGSTLEGLCLRFHGVCDTHRFEYEWPVEFVAGGCRVPIPGARLWWPKGYGEPKLYTVTAHLCQGGQVLAERTDRIGIRKVALHRTEKAGQPWTPRAAGSSGRVDTPPDPDSHFYFTVNGEPISVKGANWVPLDAFHSRDVERVDAAVALFDDLGCNMIRCWGGNVYEDHRFFDLCDQAGMLVWQDFAFACCRYPQTETFLARVRREVEGHREQTAQPRLPGPVVRRQRSRSDLPVRRPAPLLQPPDPRGHPPGPAPRRSLPRLRAEFTLRPGRPRTPGRRPHAHPGASPMGAARLLQEPVLHPARRALYRRDRLSRLPQRLLDPPLYRSRPRLALAGQRPVAGARRLSLAAQRHRPRPRRPDGQPGARAVWRDPGNLEIFALASQITQAEAKKFFIESTRLRKWATSGILWWNVIDGWPQFSDAIVDYYYGKKLAYHYIRRVQQPVALVVGEAGPDKYLPVVVCNDTRQDATVQYKVWDADDGGVQLQGTTAVPARQNAQVGRIRTYASDKKLYLIEWQVNERRFGSHYLAGLPPLSLAQYRRWLPQIAALPAAFDAAQIAR